MFLLENKSNDNGASFDFVKVRRTLYCLFGAIIFSIVLYLSFPRKMYIWKMKETLTSQLVLSNPYHFPLKHVHLLSVFMLFLKINLSLSDDDGLYPSFQFGSLHTQKMLGYWANAEIKIYHVLHDRLEQIQRELKIIEEFSEDYNESSKKALEAIHSNDDSLIRWSGISSNAILSHRMTFRYATVLNALKGLLNSPKYVETKENVGIFLYLDPFWRIARHLGKVLWPNRQDLYFSHVSILLLHEIYGFYPEAFAVGPPIETNFGGALRAIHSASIGAQAISLDYFYMAIEWIEFALQTMEKDKGDISIPSDLLMPLLLCLISRHNQVIQRLDSYNNLTRHRHGVNTYLEVTYGGQPNSNRIRGRTDYIQWMSGIPLINGAREGANFAAQCAGVTLQPESIKSSLNCYLEKDTHPYFMLNPLKVEKHSESPYILQIYDVIGNDAIKYLLQSRTHSKLSSLVSVFDIRENIRARTSAGSGINNIHVLEWIVKKSEMITGLVVDPKKESPQVIEYVYGRYYGHHTDTFDNDETDPDDTSNEVYGGRMATLLYYLEEPKLGGKTPFCNVGISAEVKRGSAVFWLNMFRNGTIRDDVVHGSCPVIHGHKIAVNQWIRHYPNFQKFKCSLNQWE